MGSSAPALLRARPRQLMRASWILYWYGSASLNLDSESASKNRSMIGRKKSTFSIRRMVSYDHPDVPEAVVLSRCATTNLSVSTSSVEPFGVNVPSVKTLASIEEWVSLKSFSQSASGSRFSGVARHAFSPYFRMTSPSPWSSGSVI